MSDLTVKYITFQPTTYCNLNCDYCYLPHRKKQERAPLKLVEELCRQLVDQSFVSRDRGLTFSWHNCEPLTVSRSFYEDAFRHIKDSVPAEVNHIFVSNGTLLDDAWADFFEKHRITPTLSIDGPAALHDRWRKDVRGRDTHARAMAGLSRLQKRGLNPAVICVLRADSLSYPQEIFEFFLTNDVRRVGFSCEEIEGINRSSTMTGAGEYYSWFLQRILALNAQAGSPLTIREMERFRAAIFSRQRLKLAGLNAGAYLSIDVKGNLSTWCPEMLGFDEFILGNLWDMSIKEAFTGVKFQTQQEAILAGVEACRQTCSYFDVCGGGEPTNKFHEHGSFRTTETLQCRNGTQATYNAVLSFVRGEPVATTFAPSRPPIHRELRVIQ